MTELALYEEAMCCSTGVCGPDPDDELVEVSAALDQLESAFDDVDVSRANSSMRTRDTGVARRVSPEAPTDATELRSVGYERTPEASD